MTERRDRLAVIGGFAPAMPQMPYGTHRASAEYSRALARAGRFAHIDLYVDHAALPATRANLSLPEVPGVTIELFEPSALPVIARDYHAIHVSEGEQYARVPAALRPAEDWAPVVYTIGIAHSPTHWLHLLAGALTGATRATDALLVKGRRQAELFRETWNEWRDRFGVAVPHVACVPNGVLLESNTRDASLRAAVRRKLAIEDDAPVFLAFSKLTAHMKGDQRALVALWREVHARDPRATLVLAGALADVWYPEELHATARALGVADRVHVVPNPYHLWPNARSALMSAADVFVHLSTGLEETMSLVVLEAMAHELPAIVADWSCIGEMVTPGHDGFRVATTSARAPDEVEDTLWGHDEYVHAGLVSQSVACDAREVIESVLRLSADAGLRRAMGQRARESVRARHAIDRVVERQLEEIDAASARAEREWRGPAPRPRLVRCDRALALLATRRLEPGDAVRVIDETAARRAPALRDYGSPQVIDAILEALRGGSATPAREVVLRVAHRVGVEDPAAELDAMWPACARLILRLADHHVVEISHAS